MPHFVLCTALCCSGAQRTASRKRCAPPALPILVVPTSASQAQTLTFPSCKPINRAAEIIEYSSADETAVCNLASIALPRFVREKEPSGREGKKLVGPRAGQE